MNALLLGEGWTFSIPRLAENSLTLPTVGLSINHNLGREEGRDGGRKKWETVNWSEVWIKLTGQLEPPRVYSTLSSPARESWIVYDQLSSIEMSGIISLFFLHFISIRAKILPTPFSYFSLTRVYFARCGDKTEKLKKLILTVIGKLPD